MAERKKGRGLAIAAVFGVGSLAALHYSNSFERSAKFVREKVEEAVALEIGYEELAKNPDDLDSFRRRIPGRERVASVIARIISDPDIHPIEVFIVRRSLDGSGQTCYQEIRVAGQRLRGLYVYSEYTQGPVPQNFIQGIASFGREKNWLVGKNYIPAGMRPSR